jgi:predicted flap endonuclease-1-like 5' DNA nuclease
MIYLIGHLAPYLIAAFLFAAFAGWTIAAYRAAPEETKRRRDRAKIINDIARLSGDATSADADQWEREADLLRRRLTVSDGRIAELESALERARARADEAVAARDAALASAETGRVDGEELSRLRGLVSEHEDARAREVEAIAQPVEPSEADVLQKWRLRYFEQRVNYLEGLAVAPAISVAPEPAPPYLEWRAREAEARAAYLADEVRARPAMSVAENCEPDAFAADVDVDALLRWRMLYLERRAVHLQAALDAARTASAQKLAAAPEPARPDPDIWKWRARYLEARVRHLETREPVSVMALPAQPESETIEAAPTPPAPAPTLTPQKPPPLAAARNGAPDDLTLIESVSVMQQATLNSIGVFHFDQIAAWSEANVAWVDRFFRLRGRVAEEEWVEQAAELARDGVIASRRLLVSEDA